jgi:hypothetical protein
MSKATTTDAPEPPKTPQEARDVLDGRDAIVDVMVVSAANWVLISALMWHFEVNAALAAGMCVVGVGYALGFAYWFSRKTERRTSAFHDPITGELLPEVPPPAARARRIRRLMLGYALATLVATPFIVMAL